MSTPPNNPVYDKNTPAQSGESLGTSQEKFLTNFQQLYDAFLRDHVALDAGATAGNHTIAQFYQQDGDIKTSVGEISAYAKNVENQTSQLFLNYQGANDSQIQYTGYQIYTRPPFPYQTVYYSFLPGNIMVYFGKLLIGNPGVLRIRPLVMKNLMSVNFCPIDGSPTFLPTFVPLASDNDVVKRLDLYQYNNAYAYHYLIIGNL